MPHHDPPTFPRDSKVYFRGTDTGPYYLRGKVEVAAEPRIGIRLENGNFVWASPENLRPRPTDDPD